jgi:hypothetical protein
LALKLDPVTILEETDRNRKAARLAAYWVVGEDKKRELEKFKSSMPSMNMKH